MSVTNRAFYDPSGNGNCALNGFGLGLLDLYLQGAFRHEKYTFLFQNFLRNHLKKSNFEALLAETSHIKTIELNLAKALREYLVILMEEDFPQKDLDAMILPGFVNYVACKNGISSDSDPMFHAFAKDFEHIYQEHCFKNANSIPAIENKLDTLQEVFAYLHGDEGEGKKRYLDYLRRDGTWLGEWELGKLAKQFHVGLTVNHLGSHIILTADNLKNAPTINMRNDSVHWQVYVSPILKTYFPKLGLARDTAKELSTEAIKNSLLYNESETKLNSIELDVQFAFTQLSTMVEIQNFLAKEGHKELQEAFDALLALMLDNLHSKGKKPTEAQIFEQAFRKTCSLVSTFFIKEKEQIEEINAKDSSQSTVLAC